MSALSRFFARIDKPSEALSRVVALPAAVAMTLLATASAHMPALAGDILGLDDRRALVESTGWRGLGLDNIRYAFTTTDMDMVRPLAWLSYGLDYVLAGVSAAALHRTSLLVHLAVALALLLFLRRWCLLLGAQRWFWPSVLPTLAFSLHPLRVQTVAWISARGDALAALFLLLASLAWLRYLASARPAWRLAWHGLFLVSLLAKPSALLAPLVWSLARRWMVQARIACPVAARAAHQDLGAGALMAALMTVPLLAAKGVAFGADRALSLPGRSVFTVPRNLVFPLWQTLWPWPLGYYEPAYPLDVASPRNMAGALAAFALAALLWRHRARAPGVALTALAYALLLAPVLNLLPFGYELVADRFSYLPALALSVGAAGWLAQLCATPRARLGAVVAAAVWLCTMGTLAWGQSQIWRDNETFWRHNLKHFPNSAMASAGLGDVANSHDRFVEARRYYERAHQLQPTYTNVFLGLGYIAMKESRFDDCIAHLRTYLANRPDSAFARQMLMVAYEAVGRRQDANAIAEMLAMERAHGMAGPE